METILLFEKIIMSVLKWHKTYIIFKVKTKYRYYDRKVIIINLIDSHDKIIVFWQKHLNDLFILNLIGNINLKDGLLRKIVSDTLAYKDY